MQNQPVPRGAVIPVAVALTLLLSAFWGSTGCGFFAHPGGEHRLTVLYFGDLHGHLLPDDSGRAGFAHLAGLVNRIREENHRSGIPTLVLVAGDCLQGTPVSTLFRGEAEFRALNMLDPDAMVLGNHEFDYGLPRLRELLDLAEFPVLANNIVETASGDPLVPAFTFHYFDDFFAATIGTVAEDTAVLTTPSNVTGLSFQPPITATWQAFNTVRYSADFCIALTHQGLVHDGQLAESINGLSLVVGGHDHLALDVPVYPREHCPVVHAGADGRFLGRLDLVFTKTAARGRPVISHCRNELIPIEDSLPEDPEIAALLETYRRRSIEAYGEPLGRLGQALQGERSEVRRAETGLGRLVTDLMREATGADAALINGGAIRASIDAGVVTLGDVITALPFKNRVVLVSLSGADIENALRHGLEASAGGRGGAFLQVSGLRFSVDHGEPEAIELGGEPLDAGAEYRVALTDFLVEGGDGFGPWLGRGPEERYESRFLVHDLLAEHIRRMEGLAGAPPAGRIRMAAPAG